VRHGLDAPRQQFAEPPLAADKGRGRPNGRLEPAPPMLASGGPALSDWASGRGFADTGPAVGALPRSAPLPNDTVI
jgi:hypothetical protein